MKQSTIDAQVARVMEQLPGMICRTIMGVGGTFMADNGKSTPSGVVIADAIIAKYFPDYKLVWTRGKVAKNKWFWVAHPRIAKKD